VRDREAEWAELMRGALTGDDSAYRRLLSALAPWLRAIARRGLGSTAAGSGEAEDIVQETLLAIHLKRHTWDPSRPLGPWLRAIARNKLIDSFRRRGNRLNVPIDGLEEILAAADSSPVVETRDVAPYVDALPEGQRKVVRSIINDEKSIRETADALKMSEGAVRVALHRGLASIAKHYRRDLT
jgi:RNA polymerase sigma-70 factor (ECF subfamily)